MQHEEHMQIDLRFASLRLCSCRCMSKAEKVGRAGSIFGNEAWAAQGGILLGFWCVFLELDLANSKLRFRV